MPKIGLVLALDGEKEFSANLRAATEAVKEAKEALNDVKEDYKDSANSLEALSKKSEALTNIQGKLADKLKAAQSGLNKSEDNYIKLTSQVKKYEEELKKEEAALENVKKTHGENSKEYKEQAKVVEKTAKALSNSRVEHTREAASMSKWRASVTKVNREIRQNNKEIKENGQYIDEARASSDGLAKSIDNTGRKVKNAGNDFDELNDDLKKSESAMKNTGTGAQTLGDVITKSLGKGMIMNLGLDLLKKGLEETIQAIKKGAEISIEFEAQMSRVKAISGATGNEYKQLEEKAKTLGRTTVYTATESAAAMEQMALAGWKTKDIITGIDGVLALAASSGMEISQAAEYVSDNVQAWGEKASYAGEMADIMAVAMSNSSMTTEDLGEAYKNVAATANTLGYDIKDVTAVLMTMANQGKKGTEAGTTLNTIMTRLATNTSDCAGVLKKYGVEVYDVNGKTKPLSETLDGMRDVWKTLTEEQRNSLAKTIAGTRQFNGLSMVMQGLSDEAEASGKSFADYTAVLNNASGAADEMSAVMLDNLKGDITLFNDALEGLAIGLGENLTAPARAVVQFGTDIVSGFTNAITDEKSEIELFAEELVQSQKSAIDSLQKAKDEMGASDQEVSKLEAYKQIVLELSEKENLNEYEKRRLKKATEELSDVIPELAQNFNFETGQIDLTRVAIEKLFDAQENLSKSNAMESAIEKAQTAYEQLDIESRVSAQALEDAKKQYEELEKKNNESIANGEWNGGYGAYYNDLLDLEIAMSTLEKTAEADAKARDEAKQYLDLLLPAAKKLQQEMLVAKAKDNLFSFASDGAKTSEEAIISLMSQLGVLKTKENDAENSNIDYAKSFNLIKSAAKDLYDVVVGKGKDAISERSTEILAERNKRAADITTEAYRSMQEQWDAYVSDVQGSIDKIDPTKAFDGGSLTTTWDQISNLDSQIKGMQEYSDNLDKLKEHVGKEVAPEFLQYVESMGLGGAAFVNNMIDALETEDGAQRVAEVSQKYVDALDISGDIAQKLALDKITIENGFSNFGSSDADFETLRNNVIGNLNNVTDETIAEINALIDSAKEIGASVPEGLADGIKSGDFNADDVKTQLSAEILGTIQGISEIVGNDKSVTQSIVGSISSGESSVKEAYEKLLTQASDVNVSKTGADSAGEESIVSPTIKALEDGQESVSEAAEKVVDAAITAINSKKEDFSQSGSELASDFAEGINNGAQNVVGASSNMVKSALANANRSDLSEIIGVNLSAGVARGIQRGENYAVNAAVSMMTRALNAAKRAADIHSPSKVWENVVGTQLPAGVAKGIQRNTKKTADSATTMMGEILYQAKAYMDSKGKKSVDDMAKTWNALFDISTENKKNNEKFGVSWYTTTGSGKSKKKVKKDAETYYSEVLSVATKYFDNVSVLYDVSEREELAYWEKVLSNLKKGTQAWYTAKQKVEEIKKNIGSFDVANSLLSGYKDFYDVSLKAEVEYWNKVRQQYKAGTENRINADNAYLKAFSEYKKKEADIQKKYDDAKEEADKNRQDSIKDLAKSYADAFDIFEEFISKDENITSGQDLLYNMQTQAAGYEFWQKQLEELSNKGVLSEALMQELADKGATATADLVALNQLSNSELLSYQQAYDKKNAIALSQAENDQSIEKKYQDELKEAANSYHSELNEINTGITSGLNELAEKVAGSLSSETTRIVNAIFEKYGTSGTTSANPATYPAATSSATPSVSTPSVSTPAATAPAASNASKASDTLKKKFEKIIAGATKKKGKLTANEKKSHSGLWEHLASQYGIDADAKIMKKLANLFGIKISSKITSTEKKSILNAMKKNGFASGTKHLDDIFAWMDEAGIGSEMVVRKSDGARLNTNVRRGDMIISAANTDNLWDWSQIVPTDMLNAIAAQNAVTQSYVSELIKNVNVGEMNDHLAGGRVRSNDELLSKMAGLMFEYMPYLADKTSISVDGRTLANATAGYTSEALAARQRRKRI